MVHVELHANEAICVCNDAKIVIARLLRRSRTRPSLESRRIDRSLSIANMRVACDCMRRMWMGACRYGVARFGQLNHMYSYLINHYEQHVCISGCAASSSSGDAYQAMRASGPLGHRLTPYFRNSSRPKRPAPKATGKNQCITGT